MDRTKLPGFAAYVRLRRRLEHMRERAPLTWPVAMWTQRGRLKRSVLLFSELVRNDLRNRPYPKGYAISQRWQAILAHAMDRAAPAENHNELVQMGLEMFDVPNDVVTSERAEFLRELRASYVGRNPELAQASETSFLPDEAVAVIDGVRFSEKMRQVFDYYEEIKTGIGDISNAKVIVEVGSGYGRLARLMIQLDRSRCYVLVDIPESLVFSYAFLRCSFPSARIKVIKDASDITPGLTKRFDIIFCPVQRLADLKLGHIDLLVNTYSFAEMTQGCVDHILDCTERVLKPRFLYSLNLVFTDKAIHFDTGGHDGEGNETVLALRPEWRPKRFDLRPAIVHGRYRITGSMMLQHVTTTAPELISELHQAAEEGGESQHMRLGSLFLAALWSRDRSLAEKFVQALRRQTDEFAFTPEQGFDFDKIGEVVVLRRALGTER
jgi:putative sugar O-methyltransferase